MKTSTMLAIAFGLTAAAGLSSAAVAGYQEQTFELQFQAIDENHDSSISRDEAYEREPELENSFSQADANDDGALNQDEYESVAIVSSNGIGV